MNEQLDLFAIQPEWCRQPLPYKEIEDTMGHMKRIIQYNPLPVYEQVRFVVNPYNRYNWAINFATMFPKREDGLCACGCGEVAKGMWATKQCQFFAVCVWNIIGGRQEFVGEVFKAYYGNKLCMKCGERDWVDIDHILPVSNGGGGAWLSNFQGLCKKCHKEKTRTDFGWTKLKTSE